MKKHVKVHLRADPVDNIHPIEDLAKLIEKYLR